ncbi:hypothetical protein ACTXT7_011349 [Hymenolepis weldensis]
MCGLPHAVSHKAQLYSERPLGYQSLPYYMQLQKNSICMVSPLLESTQHLLRPQGERTPDNTSPPSRSDVNRINL